MDCSNCELKQRQFFCRNCLRTHLRDLRVQTQHFAVDRDEQVQKAAIGLEYVNGGRLRRASVAHWQDRLEEISAGLAKLKRDNERKRDRLRTLRETIASRRQTLSAAKLKTQARQSNTREIQDLGFLADALARARSGLVQELVEVFNVVEVGGRPPVGDKGGTKGDWTIGNLILPVPGDMRRFPPDHINAVVTHTIHFLSLLTFYLGIKLPFEITWTGKKLGVGQPLIGAIKGPDSGGWAQWYTKHPLHMSETVPTASTSARASTLTSTESFVEDNSQASFTTAFAMLLYNVCYLASTQNVDVPLSQAGDVLSNLWSVCCSSDLGKRSHETTPYLLPPTPVTFVLDFNHLLQATTANPSSKARPRRPSRSSRHHRTGSAATRTKDVIIEEDGWDLVDDIG